MGPLKVLHSELQIETLLQNIEVFLDVLVGDTGACRLNLRQRGLELVPLRHLIRPGRIRNTLVEFRRALLRTLLGCVLMLHAQQQVGVFIALLDPRFLGVIAAGGLLSHCGK